MFFFPNNIFLERECRSLNNTLTQLGIVVRNEVETGGLNTQIWGKDKTFGIENQFSALKRSGINDSRLSRLEYRVRHA